MKLTDACQFGIAAATGPRINVWLGSPLRSL